MKKVLLLMLLTVTAVPAMAWQFVAGNAEIDSQQKLLILDPDSYDRHDLARIKAKGHVPVAWLNLGEIEDWRLIGIEVREKDYVFAKRFSPAGLNLPRFYDKSFKEIMEHRLREYLLKGFAGVFFAKVDCFKKVSNSPINRGEMLALVRRLTQLAKSLKARPLILVHGLEFVDEILEDPDISGIVTQGLFNARNGRHIHPWQRQKNMQVLQRLLKNDKIVLTAEMTKAANHKKFVARSCLELGIDYCFSDLPLKMQRRNNNDTQK